MMSHAWDGSRERAAYEFDDTNRPTNFLCNNASCRQPVLWNKGWLLPRTNAKVPRHFKIRQGADHVVGCRYAVEAQLKLFAALGDPIDERQRPLLRKGGRYRFRLNIVADAVKKTLLGFSHTAAATPLAFGRTYVRSAKRAMPYIRSAAGVAKLYLDLPASFERDQFKEQIIFEDRGVDVAWNDFLYEPDDYQRLLLRLDKLGPSSTLHHPISIIVKASRNPVTYASGTSQKVKMHSSWVRLDANTRVAVYVYTPTIPVMSKVLKDATYLIVSLDTWRMRDWTWQGDTVKAIGATIHYRSQIVRIK